MQEGFSLFASTGPAPQGLTFPGMPVALIVLFLPVALEKLRADQAGHDVPPPHC